jgi:hypothetical protein
VFTLTTDTSTRVKSTNTKDERMPHHHKDNKRKYIFTATEIAPLFAKELTASIYFFSKKKYENRRMY